MAQQARIIAAKGNSHRLGAEKWKPDMKKIEKGLRGHKKNDWRKIEWTNSPLANHLIMTGLVTTVGGVPIDLGFPGWINLKQCEKAKLLDL